MKRYDKTMFGLKESKCGEYIKVNEYHNFNNEIDMNEHKIKTRDRIIDEMSEINDKQDKIISLIIKSVVDNIDSDSKRKDNLVKALYGIDEDAKTVTIYINEERKTSIDITK